MRGLFVLSSESRLTDVSPFHLADAWAEANAYIHTDMLLLCARTAKVFRSTDTFGF